MHKTIKIMMGRVNWEGSHSESVMVRGRYDNPFEEHPGISNRNLRRVDLDVARTLYLGDIEYNIFRIDRVNHMLIRVVPRK